MKGSIVDAIKDLITEFFGREEWLKVLENANIDRNTHFGIKQDIPDEVVLSIIDSISKTLKLSQLEVIDAFGEYWASVYTPKVYKPYYRGIRSAKELITRLDEIHQKVIHDIPNAKPPRFEYKWENENTLIMKYKSFRNLILIFIAVLKGLAKHYKTPLEIEQISENEVRIIFPPE